MHKCLNPTWCGGENWTNGKFAQSLCTFKYRKVIIHKCPCTNALSLGTSSYLNVETEPRMNHVRFGSDIYAWPWLKHLCVDIYARWQSVQSIFTKWWPFFNFFIMANTDIPFPLTFEKPETQTLGGGGVGNLKFMPSKLDRESHESSFYRPPSCGKIVFLQVSACLCSGGVVPPPGTITPPRNHESGRYVSYRNAFLF